MGHRIVVELVGISSENLINLNCFSPIQPCIMMIIGQFLTAIPKPSPLVTKVSMRVLLLRRKLQLINVWKDEPLVEVTVTIPDIGRNLNGQCAYLIFC